MHFPTICVFSRVVFFPVLSPLTVAAATQTADELEAVVAGSPSWRAGMEDDDNWVTCYNQNPSQ